MIKLRRMIGTYMILKIWTDQIDGQVPHQQQNLHGKNEYDLVYHACYILMLNGALNIITTL